MTLAENAFVIASHATVLLIAMMMVYRAVRLGLSEVVSLLSPQNVIVAMLMLLSAVAIERIYYITARLIAPSGIDLWRAHPGPELLSLLIAGAVYGLGLPVMRAHLSIGTLKRTVLRDVVCLLAVYVALAWGLS